MLAPVELVIHVQLAPSVQYLILSQLLGLLQGQSVSHWPGPDSFVMATLFIVVLLVDICTLYWDMLNVGMYKNRMVIDA
jgi:hypothetical protein